MNKEELLRYLKKQEFPEHIIKAFENVSREKFVPEESQKQSYENIPLPIGEGQTISQPYTIAFMLMMLDVTGNNQEKKSLLEVGSGSGYVLALLDELSPGSKIYGVERIKGLAEKSQKVLNDIGKDNIEVINSDGSKGLPNKSPFDRIIASARFETIPQKLVNQLKNNGVLVTPVKDSIVVVKKRYPKNEITEYPGFRFVPMIGSRE